MDRYNARLGIWFFWLYSLIYAAFVMVNAFFPRVMDSIVWGGLNLAIFSGFGLIFLAFALSLVYGRLCQDRQPSLNGGKGTKEGTQEIGIEDIGG